jgi:hypothetical protein
VHDGCDDVTVRAAATADAGYGAAERVTAVCSCNCPLEKVGDWGRGDLAMLLGIITLSFPHNDTRMMSIATARIIYYWAIHSVVH